VVVDSGPVEDAASDSGAAGLDASDAGPATDALAPEDGAPGTDALVANDAASGDAQVDAGSGPSCSGAPRAPRRGELVLNEFLAVVPTGTVGDANQDGVRDPSNDEFVEIGSTASVPLDLRGVTVSDAAQVRHVFAPGLLECRKVIVVFGGGTPGGPNWMSNWVAASSGRLSLNDGGDTIKIGSSTTSTAPDDLASHTYGAEAAMGQSLVLIPELTGVPPYVQHSTAPGANGRLFSPGLRVDGTPF
jgi:hypothetical protein